MTPRQLRVMILRESVPSTAGCKHMADERLNSAYTTRPFTADTWDDFANLVEANNGVWGGCWCMGFHPDRVGKGRLPPRTATPSTHTCARQR